MKCFFHSSDEDGHCSGAIIRRKFPKCELIGYNYGGEFPWRDITPGETVYMVDLSLDAEDMIALNQLADFIWIDHHDTAIKSVEKTGVVIRGLRRNGDAGCELTWEYMFPRTPIPLAVKFIGRWDVCDHHSLDGTITFHYGLMNEATWPLSKLWPVLLKSKTNPKVWDIMGAGAHLRKYIEKEHEKLCKYSSFVIKFEGLKVLAMNRPTAGSKVFDSKWDPEKYDAMMIFSYQRNGGWRVSLYSDDIKDGVHLGEICKTKYGGGGHKGAAGFECKELPFGEKDIITEED